MSAIQFFYFNERVELGNQMNQDYVSSLHKKGKISVSENSIFLKDFCGYLGDTLYVPKKIQHLLNLESDFEYEKLFSNLFKELVQHFNDELLFQLFPTRLGLVKTSSHGKGSLLFQLNTLLEFRDITIFSLNIIAKKPHKTLIENEEYRAFETISYIDDRLLLDSLQNPQNWYENSPRKPKEMLQYNNFESVDTTENRFIKFFLNELSEILEKLVKFTKDIPIQKILISGLKYEIENFRNDFPLDEVGTMKFIPYSSQVLLKRDGYRELFDLYHRLYFSFRPSFLDSLDTAISLKDISSLWEYYVFIQLIELFGEIKWESFKGGLKVKEEEYEKAYIEFKSGAKIYYQHVFNSYSGILFRPDFYIEYNKKTFVIDAKFRVVDSNRTEILKNMHYYKDGLRLTSSIAIVIGNRMGGEVFSENGEKKNVSSLSEIIFAEGVGYFNIDLNTLL
jgi:predicted component of viral defense system (DUF524 family)